MSERPRCGRPRKDGSPCGQLVDDGAKCIWHGDGVTDEDRSLIARRGGLTKLRVLSPETTAEADVFTARGLLKRLQLIEHSVVTGQLGTTGRPRWAGSGGTRRAARAGVGMGNVWLMVECAGAGGCSCCPPSGA